MSSLEITPHFDLRRVAETAVVCGVLGAAGAVLWQSPGVRKFASSVDGKKVLVDAFTGFVNGQGDEWGRISPA